MSIKYGGNPEKVMVTRHGQSCTNVMGEAYSLIEEGKNPYEYYGVGKTNPPKSYPKVWYKLAKISQDPPLNNGGLCELIELYEKKYNEFTPDKVYCSSMCRAIQTAMILYPTGGNDNKIHICPWIHESPHGWLETKMTKKSRSSRDYDELGELKDVILHLYTKNNVSELLPYMGNRYTSKKLAEHPIQVELVEHPLLKEHYTADVNVNRFITEISQHDEGNIAVISHGYTMRAGCKSDQLINGWCQYFKEISPKVSNINVTCLSPPCIDIPVDIDSPCNSECKNTYVKHLRSGKNIPNGGLITINYDFDKGSDSSIDFTKFKVTTTGSILNKLYQYHYDDTNWVGRDKERTTFLEGIECIMRNLIYSWKFFAVGPSSYNSEQKTILSDDQGFCSERLLQLSNVIWENRCGKLMTKERDMFLPFLTIPEYIRELGELKRGKKKKIKRKQSKQKRKQTKKKSKKKSKKKK